MYIELSEDKLPIDERVIKKLKKYCKSLSSSTSPNNGSKVSNIFQNMLILLDDLDKAKKLIDTKVRELKLKISKVSPEIKDKIDKFFRQSMEMGLYMRGWKIQDNSLYPLKSEDTIVISEEGINDLKVHENTVKAYEYSKETLNELPSDISESIRSLHTLRFSKGEKAYRIFGLNFKGTRVYHDETLVKCMGNIYGGYFGKDSCIRSNSNWILYSSCWYRLLFGFEIPFSMDQIDDIQ
jgi:hypothetical protein